MATIRFDSSIQKNNLAVRCICQGNVSQAHALLTDAISCMRRKLDNPMTSDDDPMQHELDEIGLQSLSIFHASQRHRAVHEQSFDCSALCFFDRVFLIRRENADNERLVCATILYNFAIVFHLASSSGKRSHLHVEKVLKLYKMSVVAIDRYRSGSSEAYLLTLAILNNIAHIHSVYFNICEAHQALDEMAHMLKFGSVEKSVDSANTFVFQFNAFVHSSRQSVRFAPSA